MGITGANAVVERYVPDLPVIQIPSSAPIVIDISGAIHSLLNTHTAAIIGGEGWLGWYTDMTQEIRRWKHCNRGSPNLTLYVDGARLVSKLASGERAKSRERMGAYVASLATQPLLATLIRFYWFGPEGLYGGKNFPSFLGWPTRRASAATVKSLACVVSFIVYTMEL